MRALCETCGAPQPIDWRAGDLCTSCGGAARAEARCFWCNEWSPAGKFCRGCGAELVDDAHFGAARMLKRAGGSMLDIPRQLRELEPGRLEVFASQFARQRGVVERHVDDLRLVERHLKHGGFSRALEDELLAALPWDDTVLAAMQPPQRPADGELILMRALAAHSPLETTRRLAGVARLWLGDWGALRDVQQFVYGELAPEAALAVTWWRTAIVCNLRPDEELLRHVRASPLRAQVAVRLALYGQPHEAADLAEARASGDPDLVFAVALATGEVPRLLQGLEGDPIEQVAAALRLVDLGELAAVAAWLPGAESHAQHAVVRAIERSVTDTAPLQDALFTLMQSSPDQATRALCGIVLGRTAPSRYAPRVAELGEGDIYVLQALLSEEAKHDPHTLAEVGALMVVRGWFRMSQYGLAEAARRGAFPVAFVPWLFDHVDDEKRLQLCMFAEAQLLGGGAEPLRRFLMRVVFGPYSPSVRAGAYWSLHRARPQRYGGPPLLSLDPASLAAVFDTPLEAVERLTSVLRDAATLKEVGVYDLLADLLRSLGDEGAALLAGQGGASHELTRAMIAALDLDIWLLLKTAIVQALIRLGHDAALRALVVDALRSHAADGGDIGYLIDRGLAELVDRGQDSGILGE